MLTMTNAKSDREEEEKKRKQPTEHFFVMIYSLISMRVCNVM